MKNLRLLFIVALMALLIPLLRWHLRRSRELVDKWVTANAYTVLAIERRYFRAGPFIWRSRGPEVFHVLVRDARGEQRGAYVRTGGWFLGQLSEDVAVKWDKGSELA
jgi:hypothetical protein